LQEATNTELRPAVAIVLLVIKSLLFIVLSLGTKNTMYSSKQKINIILLPASVMIATPVESLFEAGKVVSYRFARLLLTAILI
jgi:hypothetical protein